MELFLEWMISGSISFEDFLELSVQKKQINNRKQESRPRCKSSVSFETKDPITGVQSACERASELVIVFLLFLICQTQNVSKQFRLIDIQGPSYLKISEEICFKILQLEHEAAAATRSHPEALCTRYA